MQGVPVCAQSMECGVACSGRKHMIHTEWLDFRLLSEYNSVRKILNFTDFT